MAQVSKKFNPVERDQILTEVSTGTVKHSGGNVFDTANG
jgi:hypothetical protein